MIEATDGPIFSIVIPTYNRPEQLAACLQACARLDYPRKRFEVIVVDDGGATPLDPVVAPFHGALALKLLRQENAGPATARNRGAAEARGEFLAFTDDDCQPAPVWLRALAARCLASPDCAIGGQTLNGLPHNPYSTASQLLISYVLAYYNAAPGAAQFFPSNNLTIPTKGFLALGGFDAGYPRAAAEDRELCRRWRHHGYQMTYAPEALVSHAHDLTWRTFLGQHFQYGRGARRFHRRRAQQGGRPIKVEPAAFYFNLLRYRFGRGQSVNAWILVILLALTQVANAAGFFWELGRERAR